jgi:hypothetical protein
MPAQKIHHKPAAGEDLAAVRADVAYSDTQLFINGTWRPSQSGRTIAVLNPATEETIGAVIARNTCDEAIQFFRARLSIASLRSQ